MQVLLVRLHGRLFRQLSCGRSFALSSDVLLFGEGGDYLKRFLSGRFAFAFVMALVMALSVGVPAMADTTTTIGSTSIPVVDYSSVFTDISAVIPQIVGQVLPKFILLSFAVGVGMWIWKMAKRLVKGS